MTALARWLRRLIGLHSHSVDKRIAALELRVMLSQVAEKRYTNVADLLRRFARHSEGFR